MVFIILKFPLHYHTTKKNILTKFGQNRRYSLAWHASGHSTDSSSRFYIRNQGKSYTKCLSSKFLMITILSIPGTKRQIMRGKLLMFTHIRGYLCCMPSSREIVALLTKDEQMSRQIGTSNSTKHHHPSLPPCWHCWRPAWQIRPDSNVFSEAKYRDKLSGKVISQWVGCHLISVN